MADDPVLERRETITMRQAAQIVGRTQQTVRRWFDAQEAAGRPVGIRDRGPDGRGHAQKWRRPYRDCVEQWHRQMQGLVSDASGIGPHVDETGPAGGASRGAVT